MVPVEFEYAVQVLCGGVYAESSNAVPASDLLHPFDEPAADPGASVGFPDIQVVYFQIRG